MLYNIILLIIHHSVQLSLAQRALLNIQLYFHDFHFRQKVKKNELVVGGCDLQVACIQYEGVPNFCAE